MGNDAIHDTYSYIVWVYRDGEYLLLFYSPFMYRETREVITNDILIVLPFDIFNICLSAYWCNRGIVRQIISPITSVTFESHLRRKSISEKYRIGKGKHFFIIKAADWHNSQNDWVTSSATITSVTYMLTYKKTQTQTDIHMRLELLTVLSLRKFTNASCCGRCYTGHVILMFVSCNTFKLQQWIS